MNNKQYWLTALMSSFTMATIMSGVISGAKMGFNEAWLTAWPSSFLVAWPCALALNLTVLPYIRSLAAYLSRKL